MCAMSNAYKIRLRNEYDKIMQLPKNDLYAVRPAPGEPVPYVQRYRVTYNVPTWVKEDGAPPRRQARTVVEISLKSLHDAPRTVVTEGKVPYHPNWYYSGSVCNGHAWHVNMWLYEYINFICELLQFKESRIDSQKPANVVANQFWLDHRNDRSMFPTDTRTPPVPQESKAPLTISVVKVTNGNG